MPRLEEELRRLRIENVFLLVALVEIEESIDNGTIDLQQISVGIKGLRHLLGTSKILDGHLNPGLIRDKPK